MQWQLYVGDKLLETYTCRYAAEFGAACTSIESRMVKLKCMDGNGKAIGVTLFENGQEVARMALLRQTAGVAV